MNNRDRLIIIALIIFAFLVCFMAYLTDRDIDAVHKTLEAILEQQEQQATNSTKALNDMATEIEQRLDTIEHNQEVQDIRLDNHYKQIQENDSKIAKVEKQKAEIKSQLEQSEIRTNGNRLKVRLSEYDIRLIAKVVYLEAGTESYNVQRAICSVIINQMRRYNLSAYQAIYRDGAFSVAYKVRRTTPSATSLKAVRDVARNGTTLPKNVLAFRTGHYHSFGRRYCRIGSIYFTAM